MPTRLVWVTDPHLNHAPLPAWERWIGAVASAQPVAGVVITGDISEADDVVFELERIAGELAVPIYFVLGNHDFYRSSIAQTRQNVIAASRGHPCLNYLADCDPIRVDDGVYLIGEDGWGDATQGDYENSLVRLNDFALIEDFAHSDPSRWKQMLVQQGAASAERLTDKLSQLPEDTQQIVVATHVPPFCESCWYEGKTTDQNWAPFFVCGSVGQVLEQASQARPHCTLTVLCGHTHHAGVAHIRDNLIVYTGAAQYGSPQVEGVLEIESEHLRVHSQ